MAKSMFNIYYINNEKASEISMLFDNEIVEKVTKIRNTEYLLEGNADISSEGMRKIPLISQILPAGELGAGLSRNKTNRVEDTVKVVSSKSTILKPIYEKATEVRHLDDSKVGNLIKIKGVSLAVVNEDDVLATKALMSGILTKVPIEGYGNINLTSVMEVMFKDSAYILCGNLPHRFQKNESLMLKIPMSAENEMESQYSISDIEIGKVTVLGIYRGKFSRADIEVKLNRLKALNEFRSEKRNRPQQDEALDDLDIEDGVEAEVAQRYEAPPEKNNMVHYIDVIAILQDLNV